MLQAVSHIDIAQLQKPGSNRQSCDYDFVRLKANLLAPGKNCIGLQQAISSRSTTRVAHVRKEKELAIIIHLLFIQK